MGPEVPENARPARRPRAAGGEQEAERVRLAVAGPGAQGAGGHLRGGRGHRARQPALVRRRGPGTSVDLQAEGRLLQVNVRQTSHDQGSHVEAGSYFWG